MVIENEKKMTNCPRCHKPVLNGGIFTSHAKFTIRCPWCQATLEINIQPKIVTEVVKIGNGQSHPTTTEEAIVVKPETAQPEELFSTPKNSGFRLVGYLYPEKRE